MNYYNTSGIKSMRGYLLINTQSSLTSSVQLQWGSAISWTLVQLINHQPQVSPLPQPQSKPHPYPTEYLFSDIPKSTTQPPYGQNIIHCLTNILICSAQTNYQSVLRLSNNSRLQITSLSNVSPIIQVYKLPVCPTSIQQFRSTNYQSVLRLSNNSGLHYPPPPKQNISKLIHSPFFIHVCKPLSPALTTLYSSPP